ncbi:hypothetical protein ACHAXA_007123 [Cyclostephanos tholiformis]|uniref:Uncharacterized protein n=1 Tax=Cyclostephanos tholiformis TaxID=382380 RepID=A0ABD3RYF3_9STRA
MTLSHETLRERILTGGGGSVTARGSLSKVASRYAEFLNSLLPRDDDSGSGGGAGARGGPPAAAVEAARALETELRLHDLEVRKSALSYRAHEANSSRCASAVSSLEGELSSMKDDVERLRMELVRERATRRRREEYDALARIGNSSGRDDRGDHHPSNGGGSSSSLPPPARTTKIELENVSREMAKVEGEVARARWELTVREKQIRVVMASLADLGAALGEEETRKRTTTMVGSLGGNDDDDACDEKGAGASSSLSSSTMTKTARTGNKRKRAFDDRGGAATDNGDDLQEDKCRQEDNCGAI